MHQIGHQIGSFILSIIFSPSIWIIFLIILYIVFKNPEKKRRTITWALILFLVFSNPIILNEYAKWWQPKPRDISKDSPFSCAILLGGFGSPDVDETGYFNSTADRFIQAEKLYKLGKIQHILINGGNGKLKMKGFNEAEWAKKEFIAMGIPDTAILTEDRSKNTADNAENAKMLLDSVGLKPPFLLITSAHHIPRASMQFKHAGLDIVNYPCSYFAGKDSYDLTSLIPRMDILIGWDFYMKETVGYLIYKIKK